MAWTKHFLLLACFAIADSQRYQCSLCPVGKYKNSTSNFACVDCGANTYQDMLGAQSVLACKPCPGNSYAPAASSSIGACLCKAGYAGDVANYSGVLYANLAMACNGTCQTMVNKQVGGNAAGYAIDGRADTSSGSAVLTGTGEIPTFSGMKPWWRVRFEREVLINTANAIKLVNSGVKMTTFSVFVGNDDNYMNMLTSLTLCAGPVTWPVTGETGETFVTCTSAVRGRYLYIMNGDNINPVYLTEVTVTGYLMPLVDACVACVAGSYKVSSGPGTCAACGSGKASAAVGATAASTCVTCSAAFYSGAGAAACIGCPSNTNSLPGSSSITRCSCNEGYTGAPNTLTCTAFQALYRVKKPWAHYTATKWDDVADVLIDQSGNGRNSSLLGARTAITPGQTLGAQNGASVPLTYIGGTVETQLFFPAGSIPAQFTICSVTRYASGINQERILTAAEGKTWMHGHYAQKRGLAFYGARDIKNASGAIVTPSVWNTATDNVGTPTDWLVMCSKNGGSIPVNILVNGLASGTSNRTDADQAEWGTLTMARATQLCINCKGGEYSDWQLAHLLIWDVHLLNEEMAVVSQELLSYVPSNTACTDTVSSECAECAAGKFKTGTGPETCSDCPVDTYQPNTRQTNANGCNACPSYTSTSSVLGNAYQINCKCLPGYWTSGADGTPCAPCAAGSYKTGAGNGTCTLCPANTFSAAIGASTSSTCQACPLNSKSAAGSTQPGNCTCLAGYTAAVGPTCVPCVSGTYKSEVGGGACTLCPNNTFSGAIGANASSTCVACFGNSTAERGSDERTDCHCLAGFLTLSMGAVNATCQLCSAGSYNAILGATTCSKCDGGYRSSSPGAVAREQCVGCAANLWSTAGAAQCEYCPSNTTAAALSDELVDCKCLAGYYPTQAGQDGVTCQACPSGTFKPLQGSAACTICPENSFSTAVAATSNATCQFAAAGAVCPPGSNNPSLCGCDRGFQSNVITTNVPNLARSCGTGSDACPVTVDSSESSGQGPQRVNDNMLNDGISGLNMFTAWYSSNSNGLHWAKVEFGSEAFVTAIELTVWDLTGWNPTTAYYNAAVLVGNNPDVSSNENSICKILNTAGFIQTGTVTNFNCDAPVTGKYVFISNRCNDGGNCGRMGIWELRVSGYRVLSTYCASCTSGKYKDLTGNAACTNCPARTYSNQTAARNASVCTPCYNNAFANAGSTSIWDCGCESGYELFTSLY